MGLYVSARRKKNGERSNGSTGFWLIFLHYYYFRLDIDCCAIHMCWTCTRGSARRTKCRNRTHRHYSPRIEHRTRWIVSVQVRIEAEIIAKDIIFVLVERENWVHLHDISWILKQNLRIIEIFIHQWRRNGSYETANGIQADETGILKKATSPDSSDVITAQGKGILQVLRRYVFKLRKRNKYMKI